jgi:branched-chain amino acid aminotransferase
LGRFLFLPKTAHVILHNGEIFHPDHVRFSSSNRAFRYGDAVFETMKWANGKLNFWEDHYFRLMSSMRILRMEIPMDFSPEFLEAQIVETIAANHAERQANRVRLTVYRKGEGYYTPQTSEIGYLIEIEALPNHDFVLNQRGLNIDLYKDFFVQKSMLSNLKTANAMLYTLASIYKKENALDECVLLNDEKNVAEAITSNLFMLKDGVVYTPPTESGCLKGVMRKNIISLLKTMKQTVSEELFSPFELQKADEVWLTNAISGVQWVGNYRKKNYSNGLASQVLAQLNTHIS